MVCYNPSIPLLIPFHHALLSPWPYCSSYPPSSSLISSSSSPLLLPALVWSCSQFFFCPIPSQALSACPLCFIYTFSSFILSSFHQHLQKASQLLLFPCLHCCLSPSSSWCLLFSPSPLLLLTSSPSFAVSAFPALHLTSVDAQFSHWDWYDTPILTFLSSLSIYLLHLHSISPWYAFCLHGQWSWQVILRLFPPSKWIHNFLSNIEEFLVMFLPFLFMFTSIILKCIPPNQYYTMKNKMATF